jgi:hypothetical protein
MFTVLREREPKPEPLLSIGQKIYIVSLDTISKATVEFAFLIEREEEAYHGYNLKYENGLFDTIWDYSIGDYAFATEAEAIEKTKQCDIPRIHPQDLNMTDGVGYEYIRESDGHRLTSWIAKVGDNRLFEHSFYCYHFLQTYKDTKSRDKDYKKLVDKVIEESEKYYAKLITTPEFETLYFVNEDLYASRDYAERHTIHGKEC